ncbi:nucleotide exchange factor GrpE [Candidatus Latescibacterota bacterium]
MVTKAKKKNTKKADNGKKTVGDPVADAKANESAGTDEDAKISKTAVQENESIEEKLADLNNRHLRLHAEYDNYRKRTAREMGALKILAQAEIISAILPVLDNLDRATEHRDDKTSYEDYVKGITLIEDQLRDALKRSGLELIDAVGKPFDPNFHDAILQVESEEFESGIIINETVKGYMIGERVIRHSQVVVAK